jgi:UDP-glucose 4-epimerase
MSVLVTGGAGYIGSHVVLALADAGRQHLEGGGASCTLNCGYGHGFSVKQVIPVLESVLGHTLSTKVAASR